MQCSSLLTDSDSANIHVVTSSAGVQQSDLRVTGKRFAVGTGRCASDVSNERSAFETYVHGGTESD